MAKALDEITNKLKVLGLSDKITIRGLGIQNVKVNDINSFSWLKDHVKLLKDHERLGDKLDWTTTEHYKNMISNSPRTHEERIKEIKRLVDLYENIKTNGWDKDSNISVARIPYELFPIIETVGLKQIFSCEFPPTDLGVTWYKCANYSIDGGHRCACMMALGKEEIPGTVYFLEQKEKHWYQSKDELLSGNIPGRYKIIDNILSCLVKDKTVVDVGSNAGLVSLLSKKNGAKRTYGVELSSLFLQQARETKDVWQQKKLIDGNANIEFVQAGIMGKLDLIEAADVVLFIRSIYYIGNWIDVRYDMDNSVDKIFDILKKKKNAVVVLQGNWRRKEAVAQARGKYGNKLSTIPGMVDLMNDYGMETFIINEAEHIVIAVNKDCDQDIKDKIKEMI